MTETQAGQGLVSGDRKSPSSDQVTTTTAYQGSLSSDHPIAQTRDLNNGRELAVQNDQVLKSHSEQGSVSLDHHHQQTGVSPSAPDLKEGDWVELLTGYFTGRQVQVVGFPRQKPGWVEVKGQAWLITKEYQRQDVRLIRRATT